MTLNAESYDTLLDSYISFARRLKCPEYAITNTLNSEDLTTEKKITSLKTLIGKKNRALHVLVTGGGQRH